MKVFYDFHIHSCLSPCGDNDMTPCNIAGMAALCGLQAIAVADHNSCGNCPAVLSAAREKGILAVPAMELTTAEEAHVLCLLPDVDAAMEFSAYVYSRLPDIPNNTGIFKAQLIYGENDNVIGEEPRFLLTATEISINEVFLLLREFGGVAVPAHVDRRSFSVLSNLGSWHPSWGFTAYEQYDRDFDLTGRFPEMKGLKRIFNSDAHSLDRMRDAENTIELARLDAKTIIESLL